MTRPSKKTFTFDVIRKVRTAVTVRARTLDEATKLVDSGDWEVVYELEQMDWERVGAGKESD